MQSAQTPIVQISVTPEEHEILYWALVEYHRYTSTNEVLRLKNKVDFLRNHQPTQRDYTILPADLGRPPVLSSVGAYLGKQGQGGSTTCAACAGTRLASFCDLPCPACNGSGLADKPADLGRSPVSMSAGVDSTELHPMGDSTELQQGQGGINRAPNGHRDTIVPAPAPHKRPPRLDERSSALGRSPASALVELEQGGN